MSEVIDPEINTLNVVCSVLGSLDSDEARRRVLDFAYAKFKLNGSGIRSDHRAAAVSTSDGEEDSEELFAKFAHTKPAANVALLVARHYSRYGTQPFSVLELKEQADAAGLVVPARIDMTLVDGGRNGKRFYQKLGAGKFRVTVHGEAFLKQSYGVRKGTMQRARDESSAE